MLLTRFASPEGDFVVLHNLPIDVLGYDRSSREGYGDTASHDEP
jgi:hypothetical protein